MISTDYSKSEEMAKEMTYRNCGKCVHHIRGYCDSWDCNMQTVDDVKKEAVNEYIKAVVKELDIARTYNDGLISEVIPFDIVVEILKAGMKNE